MDTAVTKRSGKWLSRKEIEAALEFGYELELWLFEMYWVNWLRWKVQLLNPATPEPENPTPETINP